MTGKAILEAMSFIDETYIEEAETGTLRKSITLRKLIPMAACLCAVISALWLGGMEFGAESAPMDQEIEVSDIEIVVMHKEESRNDAVEPAIEGEVPPQISEVPSIVLRITEWNETGFTAIVERHVDFELFPLGETVQVEFHPNVCIEVVEGDLIYVTRRIPTEADFQAGTLVQICYVSVSQETGVILAKAIFPAPEA